MWLVKKTPLEGGDRQILREMGDSSVQWNGEDTQPRWKDEGWEGPRVAAWRKPIDVTDVSESFWLQVP